MKKQLFDKNDAGTLMIEALAMLALIAMVTPILYKKAAERTTELQDINAASQMRVMSKALDDYIRDNYDAILNGRTVTNDCGGAAASVDYTDLADDAQDETYQEIDVGHLCDYLPYGFVKADGTIQGSSTFDDYRVVLARKKTEVEVPNEDGSTTTKDVSHLTGFMIADPKNELPMVRASRIASMIGSNGGYAQGGTANGVQGVWKIEDMQTTLGLSAGVDDGAIITSSVQPISSGGGLNENLLYRTEYPGRPDLNTMQTTLYMGGNNIENINKLIVDGDDLGAGEAGLEINNGGIDVGEGKFEVDGDDGSFSAADGAFEVDGSGNANMGNANMDNANIGGNANVSGGLDVSGDASIGGATDIGDNLTVEGTTTIGGATTINNTLNVTQDTTLGKNVNVGGNLTVGGNTTLNGPTKINSNLTVTGNSTLNNLTVNGNTNLNGPTVIDSTLEVTGDATFDSDVSIGGDLTVEGELKADDFRSKTLYGGLIGNDWASNPANDRFGFTAEWARGNPANSHVWAGPTDEFHVTQGKVEIDPSGITSSSEPQFRIYKDGSTRKTEINNGMFIVDTPASSGGSSVRQIETDANYVHLMKDGAGALLSVSNDDTTDKGSVHVRKGALEIETIRGVTSADGSKLDAGYVKADRFLDNYSMNVSQALPKATNSTGYTDSSVRYDAYQVNPAYTSVMHDIKLTTRGGSRLSDILPDFINKGIYVVDNTYNENVKYWGDLNLTVKNGKVEPSNLGGGVCNEYTCWTSPWMGIIPAPQCPPGYARVVTITPAGWAMAQAGVPGILHTKRQDLWTPSYPYNPSDPEAPSPLYFQKSTWLRANVYPHGEKANFYGWSAIMGFMYPYLSFKDYIDDLGGEVDINGSGSVAQDELVVWNLFPVMRRQLEAYVTVYCYFDRNNSRYYSTYVDQYDQLNDFRKGWSKDSDFVKRLNDPALSYTDPW